VPLDCGTSNRAGSRYGPRQIRAESVLVRPYGMATGAAPFDSFQVADTGDVALNTYNLEKSVASSRRTSTACSPAGAKTVAMGGDHTITLPILRAQAKRTAPGGGARGCARRHERSHVRRAVTHGTIFRRAIEEGLIEPVCDGADRPARDRLRRRRLRLGAAARRARGAGRGLLVPLPGAADGEVREQIGSERPVYLSFDIDGLDPSVAPGTGTPEPAGLMPSQGIEVIRGVFGLNLIGADLVEVSPPYDTTGNTALLAANLLFEMLCSFPGWSLVRTG
jgi:guanidinobutyrase